MKKYFAGLGLLFFGSLPLYSFASGASGLLLSPTQTVIGLVNLSSAGIASTTDAISATTYDAYRRDTIRLAKRDAKNFLAGGEMSDLLAELMNEVEALAEKKGVQEVTKLSDRQLALEIYTFPLDAKTR